MEILLRCPTLKSDAPGFSRKKNMAIPASGNRHRFLRGGGKYSRELGCICRALSHTQCDLADSPPVLCSRLLDRGKQMVRHCVVSSELGTCTLWRHIDSLQLFCTALVLQIGCDERDAKLAEDLARRVQCRRSAAIKPNGSA